MEFVALVLAFVLGYLAQNGKHAVINEIRPVLEKYGDWFNRQFTSTELSTGWVGLLLFALVPSALLGVVIYFISGGFILLLLVFHILVLFFCLVPIEPEIAPAAENNADAIIGTFDIGQIVSVIFWYFIFGVVGALSIKLLFAGRTREQIKHQVERLLFVLNWLPGRLLILSYSLVGNFHGVLTAVGQDIFKVDHNIEALEVAAEKSALWPHHDELAADEAITQLAALYRRAIICWLTMIALLTITI